MEPNADPLLPEWKDLPPLREDEVQVFALRTGEPGLLARARLLLSPAELERAARIRVDGAREEFVVGRAALRALLARATGCRPESLPLGVDAFGKPFVAGVYSNVSHSRGLIYLALCRSAPVGIDVEGIDPGLEALEIAQANFAPEETAAVAAAADGWERARTFCRLWTRKEAVAKAHGKGLQIPLQRIQVPAGAGGVASILGDEGAGNRIDGASREYHVREIAAVENFLAALAVQGRALPVTFFPVFSP